MTTLRFPLIALVSAIAAGQSLGVQTALRADPPSSALMRRFTASSRIRGITNGPTFYTRILLDKFNQTYFGYELLLEPQPPGGYLATFGKLGVTPLDLAAGSSTNLGWSLLPLPAIPDPLVMHEGEKFSIDLFVDAATGEKLIDDIRITPARMITGIIPTIPTVSGTAHDFSVSDAELQIVQPRVTLNRSLQISAGPAARNVHGAIVWLYLPDHGRYIFSLLPRAALGFKKAGEVRGGTIAFTLDGDSIKLECTYPIAPGDAPYNLYVLHDEDWEPTAERQKDWPTVGTVGAGELAALKRK